MAMGEEYKRIRDYSLMGLFAQIYPSDSSRSRSASHTPQIGATIPPLRRMTSPPIAPGTGIAASRARRLNRPTKYRPERTNPRNAQPRGHDPCSRARRLDQKVPRPTRKMNARWSQFAGDSIKALASVNVRSVSLEAP